MITAGIDIGSLSTKAALVNERQEVIAFDVVLTGGNNRSAAETTYENVLAKAGLARSDIQFVVSTGYGRENISADVLCRIGEGTFGGLFFWKRRSRILGVSLQVKNIHESHD